MKQLFIIFLCFNLASCLNLLVYQTLPGSSHIAFSGKIVDTLVHAGHTVVSWLESAFWPFKWILTSGQADNRVEPQRTLEWHNLSPPHSTLRSQHTVSLAVVDAHPQTLRWRILSPLRWGTNVLPQDFDGILQCHGGWPFPTWMDQGGEIWRSSCFSLRCLRAWALPSRGHQACDDLQRHGINRSLGPSFWTARNGELYPQWVPS